MSFLLYQNVWNKNAKFIKLCSAAWVVTYRHRLMNRHNEGSRHI